MDVYSVLLFVHIVGALLLFVVLTVEGVSLRAGFSAAAVNRVLGPISGLAVLLPGLYLMRAQWGWTGWTVVGLVTWVLIAAAGSATGIAVLRGQVSRAGAVATLSWAVRVGMALAVVFDMTVKPALLPAAVAIAVGAALGALLGTLMRSTGVPVRSSLPTR